MDRDQAKETAKGKLEEYLLSKGIDTRKSFTCLNPQHADHHPSMSFDRERNRVKCFACGATYDVFDLVGMDYGLDGKAKFDKTYELFGIRVDEPPWSEGQKQAKSGQAREQEIEASYIAECQRRLDQTDYYRVRGLSMETLRRHGVGFDPCFKTKDSDGNYTQWGALIIPTGAESYTARNTDVNAGHKDRYRKRGLAQIFSAETLQTATKPILIVEGALDAMSVEEVGGAAIGLGSISDVTSFLKLLETQKPSQPIIIAFDNESEQSKREQVENAEKQLSDGIERLGIPFYRFHPFAGFHDANEALVSDKEAFAAAVSAAEDIKGMDERAKDEKLQAYLATSNAGCLQHFVDGIADSVNTPPISTGFRSLDKALDGGFYEGLITIGAISSLGKTSLLLQICDQIAEAGHDVLFVSLEMARTELISKSISRHTLQIAMRDGIDTRNAKTARGITDGRRYASYSRAENELIRGAIIAYGAYADRIFMLEGMGDVGTLQIREAIENHIRLTGKRPLAVIDYLQVIAPYNERATDKTNVDHNVLELKRISRDYKIPLLAISSLNRASYAESVSMASFKESGAVEYGSDILIGLQFQDSDATAEKKRNPRQIEAVILKNRQAKVGDRVHFAYYPMFSYFEDKGLSE